MSVDTVLYKKLQIMHQEQQRLQSLLWHQQQSNPICQNCGSKNLYFEGSFNDRVSYEIWECADCGMSQLKNTLDEFSQQIAENENLAYEPPLNEEEIEAKIQEQAGLVDFIERLRTRGRLLEIGCGNGFLLEAVRRRGWEVHGIEPSQRAHRFATNQLGLTNIHFGSVETYMLAEQFDLIVGWHVLEHVPSIQSFLSHTEIFLKPHGYLFIQVPSFDHFRHLLPWENYPANFNAAHRWYFTKVSLALQLMRNKLTPIRVFYDETLKFLTAIATKI